MCEIAQLYGALHHRQAHVDDLRGRRAVVPGPHIALERDLQEIRACQHRSLTALRNQATVAILLELVRKILEQHTKVVWSERKGKRSGRRATPEGRHVRRRSLQGHGGPCGCSP